MNWAFIMNKPKQKVHSILWSSNFMTYLIAIPHITGFYLSTAAVALSGKTVTRIGHYYTVSLEKWDSNNVTK